MGLENNHDADDLCAFRVASPQGGAGSMGNLVMLVGVTLDWGWGEVSLGLTVKDGPVRGTVSLVRWGCAEMRTLF